MKMSLYKTREEALAADGLIFVHYKGGIYRVLYAGVKHSETSEYGVVYEHLYPHTHAVYYRPSDLFFGKLPDGTPRFAPAH